MLRFFNKRIHNRKGFTLIELIVVIAILGILTAIAVPRFIGTMNNSKLRADQASARTIVSAIGVGEAEGTYTLSGTTFSKGATTVAANAIVAQLVTDGYLVDAPVVKSGTGGSFSVNIAGGTVDTITGGGATHYPAPTT